jgi:hypothetical protein
MAGGRSVTVCAFEYNCVIAKLDACHEQAIEQAEQRRHRNAAQDGQGRRHTEFDRELGHDDAAQRHHHTA